MDLEALYLRMITRATTQRRAAGFMVRQTQTIKRRNREIARLRALVTMLRAHMEGLADLYLSAHEPYRETEDAVIRRVGTFIAKHGRLPGGTAAGVAAAFGGGVFRRKSSQRPSADVSAQNTGTRVSAFTLGQRISPSDGYLWKAADGTSIAPRDMDDSRLINTVRYVDRTLSFFTMDGKLSTQTTLYEAMPYLLAECKHRGIQI